MRKNIRTPDDYIMPQQDYFEKRFGHRGPATLEVGRLTIGPPRFYQEFHDSYIRSVGLQLFEANYLPAEPGKGHKHDHEEQAYYVVHSRANVKMGDCYAEVGPGGITYIPPGTIHGYNNVGDELLTILDIHAFLYDDLPPTKLKLSEIAVPPGYSSEMRSDDDREAAYYVVSGLASVTVGDEEATMGPRGAAYLPRGVTHGFRNAGRGLLTVVLIENCDVKEKAG